MKIHGDLWRSLNNEINHRTVIDFNSEKKTIFHNVYFLKDITNPGKESQKNLVDI